MEERFTITAYSENSPGILHRITVLFTKRKVNIESLTVSETEKKGVSRFTIVVDCSRDIAEKIAKQIRRIIEIRHVSVNENRELIYKEIAFIKVNTESGDKRISIEELAHRHGASLIYAEKDAAVVEKTGREDEIDSLFFLLEPFGIKEFVRSGRIALVKNITSSESKDGAKAL